MPLASDVDLESYAETSYGFVGADIALHCKEAAMHALRLIMVQMKEGQEVPPDVIDALVINHQDFTEARRSVEPSAMRELYIEVPKVPWDMVAGLDNVKREIEKTIEWPLKKHDAFERLKIKPPKGILLFGPPGSGKTLLAKAIAAKSKMNFISVKGPELLSKWVGDSEKQVREAFRKARQSAPSIIFFDEIDALVQKRGQSFSGSKVGESVLSQILTEMDGIEELKDVMIIAATNRPDMLDPAIIRPGRLEKHIYVPAPDQEARAAILRLYLNDVQDLLDETVDPDKIAAKMKYYVGADIQAFVREIKLALLEEALTNNIPGESFNTLRITEQHLNSAMEEIRGTLENRSLEMFETGAWEILYPRSKREILMRAALAITKADKKALDKIHSPELQTLVEDLRDRTFWQEKDFRYIEELTKILEKVLES